MKIVIIVPTYNERKNIELLIPSLEREFSQIHHQMSILVVDDNSPDGTGDCVRALIATYPNLHLITGEKKGLGAAYIRGMRYALDRLGAQAVMEMDADFSHKPEDVPRLIAQLDEGADFVIGSRYVQGGKIPENWGTLRKAISKWGNIFARYLAGLYRVRDCTAGFRAIRASLLRQIDFSVITVKGYAFQIALLHQAMIHNAVIRELPVEFVDRVRGDTKLSLSDIKEFLINVWWIRFQASKTFLKFAAVGLSGVAVNLSIFIFLTRMGLSKYIASPLAIEVSIVNNFLLNNYWTFKHRNASGTILLKGLKFKSVSLLALIISYISFLLFNFIFPATPAYVNQAMAIIPATVVNYFLNFYWTFKDKSRPSFSS
jgi:dolichol-phosphate mannosyltransferase